MPLLGSGFQRRPFPSLWVPEISCASAISFYQQRLTGPTPQSFSNSLTHLPTASSLTNSTDWLGRSRSQSQSYATTDGQSVSLSWCQALIWGTQDNIFTTVRQLRICWCGAPSLTRGQAGRLILLLVLAGTIILGSESRGTHDHILLSQIRDSLNLEWLTLSTNMSCW
jgi:hypothetical protein